MQTTTVEVETPPLQQSEEMERVTRERDAMEEEQDAEDRVLAEESAQLEKEIEQEIRGMF